ncbi:MAG: TrkA C-terminal domain-containing protein, partial [Proteobacteria bacterium]|nr:TrkA C-terminal domain-containing protein [Pseudomonadota bacterium]
LRAAGAAEVVPEAIEGSLMLASHAMVQLGVPLRRVVHRVQVARGERYASLRGFIHGAGDAADDDSHVQMRMHSVTLHDTAYAIGKSLTSLNLHVLGVEVASVRRGQERIELGADLVLLAGDVVVLKGVSASVAQAEARLLKA